MGVEEGVPEGAAVGLVVEQAPREDVGVDSWGGVHGVGSHCGVDDGLCLLELVVWALYEKMVNSPDARSSRLLRSCTPRRRNGH